MGAEGDVACTSEEGARCHSARRHTNHKHYLYIHTQAAHLNPITVLCDSATIATLQGAKREYTHELFVPHC